MGQGGIICDDVGWWSGLNKGGDSIDDVYIGLGVIVKGMGTKNHVGTSHGVPIGSSVILIDGGRIPWAISFLLRM